MIIHTIKIAYYKILWWYDKKRYPELHMPVKKPIKHLGYSYWQIGLKGVDQE